MARIHEIREAIDTKLDKLEANATALEAQLGLTKAQAIERLEAQKQRSIEILNKFKAEIDKSKQIAEEKKEDIRTQLDNLKVQLALGKAEARDAYESQKEKIFEAIISFKVSIDQGIDEVSEEVTKELVAEENALDVELEALTAQFELEKAKQQAQFEKKKDELTEQITKFRADLEKKRQMGGEKLTSFEGEFSSGLDQIKKAFSNLVS